MRYPLRQQHGAILRKVPLIKDQKKLSSVRTKSLNGMREAGWENPEIALADVADEHGAIWVHHRDTGIAVEYVSPFVGSVPVHFAIAACGQAHLDAGNILGRRKFALSHLVGPSALLNPLLHQIERVPDGAYIAVVGGRRSVRVRIQIQKRLVLRARIA